ncbi:hypothetical protein GOBAR_AA09672 [Gossypium barbadense]|uniref:Small nuclear ribonucleoprotein G n=1 Tax=Gossypium barbadense TaxID=3634 RepID=A0A2P5Y5V7_GOSBA|nr:hypothetical protein GOBAR_AA09672 [Gossypium barbadense]
MSRSGQPPDLKKYMDKKLQIKLNANRLVVGTLRGFDQFMNLVVDNTVEVNGNEKTDIGMVDPSKKSKDKSKLRSKESLLEIIEKETFDVDPLLIMKISCDNGVDGFDPNAWL